MLVSIKRRTTVTARPRLRRGRLAGAVGTALAVTAVLSACASGGSSPAAQGSGSASPTAQSCAWPTMIGAKTDNSVVPDTGASYWVEPIVASKNAQIVISGRFPDARYVSLAVYKPDGSPFTSQGVGSSLADYQIKPGSGSQNPWQRQAAPGGRYTVTIRSDVSSGQANVLPLPPGTSTQHPGYLLYRVYLPQGNNFSGIPLPSLTVRQGGTSHTLTACQKHDTPVVAPSRSAGGAAGGSGQQSQVAPVTLRFYKPGAALTSGLLGNADTAYVTAWVPRPSASDVAVVTGKAPTTAPGSHPSPWPSKSQDVRYWSMCIGAVTKHVPTVANRLANGSTDYGCRADDATRLNGSGDYTYVIGKESQRAAISKVPGATFLPLSTSLPAAVYLLLLREMLVNPSFRQSAQSVTKANSPSAASAAMGAYYPQVSVCPLATLAAQGVQACTHRS